MTKAKSDVMGTPDLTMNHSDPMAEDELNDILTEFAFGIIHLQKELEHDKKHHTFTATHGHRDKALAAINAYTTNKIIERLEMIKATDSTRWVTNPSGMAGISFNVIDEHIAGLRKTL